MLYENIRIKYILPNGEEHVYISDFYDKEHNIIYEIKPDNIYKKQKKRWMLLRKA